MVLIRSAELNGHTVDLSIEGGRIAAIGPSLSPKVKERIVEARGGAILPGLHDHHIHLRAAAAAQASVPCGPPRVHRPQDLVAALMQHPGDGWLRGVNYQETGDWRIDRDWLDRHGPSRPVRIQHRSGRMWVLNSAAIERLALQVPQDGRLIDRDEELRAALQDAPPDLRPLGQMLLRRGVTGLTDATVRNRADDVRAFTSADMDQHIFAMGQAMPDVDARLHSHIGCVKFHYHDHDLPALDVFAAGIARAHDEGRGAAVHCVTQAELFLALAAFELAGTISQDRIEHASITSDAAIEIIARLGLTIVSQPHFLTEKASVYLSDVAADEIPLLYRLNSFVHAGVSLAAGSDAPFGGIDPWRSMAAAVHRPAGFGEGEALSHEAALALYTGHAHAPGTPRQIGVGEPADLCIIDRRWAQSRTDLADVEVKATIIAGMVKFER